MKTALLLFFLLSYVVLCTADNVTYLTYTLISDPFSSLLCDSNNWANGTGSTPPSNWTNPARKKGGPVYQLRYREPSITQRCNSVISYTACPITKGDIAEVFSLEATSSVNGVSSPCPNGTSIVTFTNGQALGIQWGVPSNNFLFQFNGNGRLDLLNSQQNGADNVILPTYFSNTILVMPSATVNFNTGQFLSIAFYTLFNISGTFNFNYDKPSGGEVLLTSPLYLNGTSNFLIYTSYSSTVNQLGPVIVTGTSTKYAQMSTGGYAYITNLLGGLTTSATTCIIGNDGTSPDKETDDVTIGTLSVTNGGSLILPAQQTTVTGPVSLAGTITIPTTSTFAAFTQLISGGTLTAQSNVSLAGATGTTLNLNQGGILSGTYTSAIITIGAATSAAGAIFNDCTIVFSGSATFDGTVNRGNITIPSGISVSLLGAVRNSVITSASTIRVNGLVATKLNVTGGTGVTVTVSGILDGSGSISVNNLPVSFVNTTFNTLSYYPIGAKSISMNNCNLPAPITVAIPATFTAMPAFDLVLSSSATFTTANTLSSLALSGQASIAGSGAITVNGVCSIVGTPSLTTQLRLAGTSTLGGSGITMSGSGSLVVLSTGTLAIGSTITGGSVTVIGSAQCATACTIPSLLVQSGIIAGPITATALSFSGNATLNGATVSTGNLAVTTSAVVTSTSSTLTLSAGLTVPSGSNFTYLGGINSLVIQSTLSISGNAILAGLQCSGNSFPGTIATNGNLTLSGSVSINACPLQGDGALGVATSLTYPTTIKIVSVLNGGVLAVPAGSTSLTSLDLFGGSVSATTGATISTTTLTVNGQASLSNVGIIATSVANVAAGILALTPGYDIVNNGVMTLNGNITKGSVSNYGTISSNNNGYINTLKNYKTLNVAAATSITINSMTSPNGTISVYGIINSVGSSAVASLSLFPNATLQGIFYIGSFSWNGGNVAGNIFSGGATIPATSNRTVSGYLTLYNTTKISGPGPATFYGIGYVENAGQLDATTASPLLIFCNFINNGVLTMPNNGEIDVYGSSTLEQGVTGSNIKYNVTGTATFNWAPNANNDISNLVITSQGSLIFAQDTSFNNLNITGAVIVNTGASITGTTIQCSNGTLSGDINVANLTVSNVPTADSASITVTRVLLLNSNFNIDSDSSVTLANMSSIEWQGYSFIGSGKLISRTSIQLPTYNPFVGVGFENYGQLSIPVGGSLTLTGASNSTINLPSNSSLIIRSGQITNTIITGSGIVDVNVDGSASFSGAIQVPYISITGSGTFDFTGTPIQSYITWSSGSINNIVLGPNCVMVVVPPVSTKKRAASTQTLYGTMENSGSLLINSTILLSGDNATIQNDGNMLVSTTNQIRIGGQEIGRATGYIINNNQSLLNASGLFISSRLRNFGQMVISDVTSVVDFACVSGNLTIAIANYDLGLLVSSNSLLIGSNATLTGAGTIRAVVTNNGTVIPGLEGGISNTTSYLNLSSFSQTSSGNTIFRVLDTLTSTKLFITSPFSLSGTATIILGSYNPGPDKGPLILSSDPSNVRTGDFTNISPASVSFRIEDNNFFIVDSAHGTITATATQPGSKNDSAVIGGAIGGAVGGSILIAGAVGAAVYYKKKKRVKKVPARPSAVEMEGLSFSKGIHNSKVSKKDTSRLAQLTPLYDLLLERPLILAGSLCDITAATEIDRITQSLVYLFENKGRALELIERSIDKEAAACQSAGTLFRQNSPASKMLHSYATLIGIPYLYDTLAAVLFELMEQAKAGGATEIDPNKLTDDDNADVNKYLLMATAQKILSAVFKSLDKVPLQLRVLCHHLQTTVVAKFPESQHSCVGGFFFLRFINPAILTPESYGISRELPSAEARRVLVLVTKTLQNLANGIKFGGKEQHMASLNDFIDTNQVRINKFFDDLATVPPSAPSSFPPTAVPANVQEVSLASIHKQISLNMPKMRASLTGEGSSAAAGTSSGPAGQQVWEQLSQIMDNVGPPVEYEEDK